jgi:microcystin-dependent protein
MSYDLYPAVDEDYQFPPEVREALAVSVELRNTVIPMTQTVRNNLSGPELWDGRLVFNTTTSRIDYYDEGTTAWIQVTSEPAGIVKEYGGDTAPAYHVMADGSTYPRDGIYANLFSVYGTKYNLGGEPGTHFRVPDRRGRMGVGKDASQTEFNTLGKIGGTKTHTLTAAEMPTHGHNVNHGHSASTATDGGVDHLHSNGISDGAGTHAHNVYMGDKVVLDGPFSGHTTGTVREYSATPGDSTTGAGGHNHTINNGAADRSLNHAHGVTVNANNFDSANAGSGGAHNNLSPYIAMNYIITL